MVVSRGARDGAGRRDQSATSRAATPRARRQVGVWLLACAALVAAMVVLGGATRLTGSGLSIVAWEPVTGIVPPLTDEAWAREFARYRESPQFRTVNSWMGVDDFKRIYWLEFWHRALGRLIGVVFFVPLAFFLATRRLERGMGPKLVTVFVLGGLQGLLGWYMVSSGLIDEPRVSQYRLTAHLALATAIYAYLLWVALGLLAPARAPASRGPPAIGRAVAGLAGAVFVTMLSGGFVAGLHAGLAYNTFPLMNGRLIPEGYWTIEPAWRNWFENVAAVQFDHRALAVTTLIAVLTVWITACVRGTRGRGIAWLHAAAAMACLQVSLGIATLLLHVPTALAVTHQGGALVLLSLLLCSAHALRAGTGRGG